MLRFIVIYCPFFIFIFIFIFFFLGGGGSLPPITNVSNEVCGLIGCRPISGLSCGKHCDRQSSRLLLPSSSVQIFQDLSGAHRHGVERGGFDEFQHI